MRELTGEQLRATGYILWKYTWNRKTGAARFHYEKDGQTICLESVQPRYARPDKGYDASVDSHEDVA